MKQDLPSRLAALWLVVLCLAAIFAGALDPIGFDLASRLEGPSSVHWLGSDEVGRDLLARLAHGARYALLISGGATMFTVILGGILGIMSAWRRGWLERSVSLGIDFFWAVPVVVVVTLLIAALGVSAATLILAIGGINWVTSARIFRSETEVLRNADSLRTARAFGFRPWRLFTVHIVPQLRAVIFTVLGLCAVETLTLETGLAFLGLRLPPPIPTWGGMLADGTPYLASAKWLVAAPAIVIVLTLGSLRVLAARASVRL
jgi:peptide/nickel transport system permease protein